MQVKKIKLYRPFQVAQIFGVEQQVVYRMVRSGELKGGKVGGQWFITEEVIINYLKEKNLIPLDSEPDLDAWIGEKKMEEKENGDDST